MKKILAFAALAAVAVTGTASAQTLTNSASATVTAGVVVPVTIENLTGMDFGDLERGVPTTIVANTPQGASFHVLGDEGDNVVYNFPASFQLTLDNYGANTNTQGDLGVVVVDNQTTVLNVTTNAYIRHMGPLEYTGGLTAEVAPGLNNPHPLSAGAAQHGAAFDAANPGMGQMYLYVGGTVTPSADQQRGEYTGTLNVSVDYSN